MICRWCNQSETGLCYAHFVERRERYERARRNIIRLAKLALVAVSAWLAYGWWLL